MGLTRKHPADPMGFSRPFFTPLTASYCHPRTSVRMVRQVIICLEEGGSGGVWISALQDEVSQNFHTNKFERFKRNFKKAVVKAFAYVGMQTKSNPRKFYGRKPMNQQETKMVLFPLSRHTERFAKNENDNIKGWDDAQTTRVQKTQMAQCMRMGPNYWNLP